MVKVVVKSSKEKDPYGVRDWAYGKLKEENRVLYEKKLAHLKEDLEDYEIMVIIDMDDGSISFEAEPYLPSPLRERVLDALLPA
nr:MAG TPA: hypothetical protein [Caudoviricetes sp.]